MKAPKLTKKQLNETVTIKCYNNERKMRRGDAIDFYLEAAMNSEGSEHERYFWIYIDLIFGEMYCHDE